jgi:SAM-dependent methyltransferase
MAAIDALTSATLKHLRESWWDDAFTGFLAETLAPRPGNRILDVGCGEGLAEVAIGRLHISQLRLVGIDLAPSKVAAARQETISHNQRVGFAAADAGRLPFKDGVFDSIYCVAVLQHIDEVDTAVREFARVTAPRGRVLAVEPDNNARYGFSSTPMGQRAFELSAQFFIALAGPRGDRSAIGPHLQARRDAVERSLRSAKSDAAAWLGREYLDVLAAYQREAQAAGSSFVEIQNTMLFATVGQKT